jgi:hypothetical protein
MAPPIPTGKTETFIIQPIPFSERPIKSTDIENLLDRLERARDRRKPVVPVFPKPLVCLPGESRPYLVPEYAGKNECGIDQAKEGIKLALDSYEQSCKDPKTTLKVLTKEDWEKISPSEQERLLRSAQIVKNTSSNNTPVKFRAHPLFKFEAAICHDEKGGPLYRPIVAIPIFLKKFNLLNPPHPFFNIAYRVNADQLHDFRSAKVFLEIAEKLKEKLIQSNQRSFHITYPASGSHMTPLAVPLKLIDQKVIDRASLTFTELDPNAVGRIEAYLKGSSDLFKNLKTDLKVYRNGKLQKVYRNLKVNLMDFLDEKFPRFLKKGEYEVHFSWLYQNKPVSLTVAIARSKSYSREEYLARANLLVIHDMGDPSDAEKLVNQTTQLRRGKKNVHPAWVVMEGSEKYSKEIIQKGIVRIAGFDHHAESWKGLYGCGYIEEANYFDDDIRSVKGKNSSLKLVKKKRNFFDPFYRIADPDYKPRGMDPLSRVQDNGFLKVHRDQQVNDVLLVRLP